MALTNQPDAFPRLLIQRLINLGQPVTTAQPTDLKAAGILYCHEMQQDKDVLSRMQMGDPGMKVIILNHEIRGAGGGFDFRPLDPFPVLTPGSAVFSASNLYATLSFLHVIKAAQAEGLDWFFLIEPDCRFSGHGWLRALWQELLMIWTPQMVCAGTPVAWNGYSSTLGQITRLSLAVKEQTGLGMDGAFIKGQPASVGINGALGWYKTEAMADIFSDGLRFMDAPRDGVYRLNLNDYCNDVGAWDYHLGRYFADLGNYDQTIGILSGSYSACGDSQMDEQARLQLLADGKKLAVHQVKGVR